MNKTSLMSRVEPVCDLAENLDSDRDRDLFMSMHLIPKRSTVDELSDNVGAGVRKHTVKVRCGDCRVIELSRELNLVSKAVLGTRVCHRTRAKDLEGNFTAGIAIEGSEDDSHTSATEDLDQLEAGVDDERDQFDAYQFYKTIETELNVRAITAPARNTGSDKEVYIMAHHR